MNHSDAGKKGYEKTKHLLDAKRQEKSRKTRETYEASPKICPACGDVLPYEKRGNKFCDHSCAASYHKGSSIPPKKRPPKTCPHCGNLVEKRNNKYCDACIVEGIYNKPQSLDVIKSDRGRRHFLIRERGHQCENCGLEEWNDLPIPIEVHHVDGNPDHNVEENLRLLCPNCHAQTEFYKGAAATRGKGRHSIRRQNRRKRYQDGESY